jgi:hypothetical protein
MVAPDPGIASVRKVQALGRGTSSWATARGTRSTSTSSCWTETGAASTDRRRTASPTRPRLTGQGKINGQIVDCITSEWLVRFHTGYQPDETDRADVAALCERFGIPVLSEYLESR